MPLIRRTGLPGDRLERFPFRLKRSERRETAPGLNLEQGLFDLIDSIRSDPALGRRNDQKALAARFGSRGGRLVRLGARA
jgi:hypothetical protein